MSRERMLWVSGRLTATMFAVSLTNLVIKRGGSYGEAMFIALLSACAIECLPWLLARCLPGAR